MCGIAGVAGGPPGAAHQREAEVAAMVARLHHRGPDASGTKRFEGCVLGHTRLRIVDLSPAGDQPMANEDGTVWTVFNGEIYNFGELRAELGAAGHRFRSTTDTEVLVHLYEQHGADDAAAMVHRLRGMFAFAIWDEPRGRLLLARDRLGIKPLYYRGGGRPGRGTLAFASEVRALAGPGHSIDPEAVASYLRLGWVAGPATIVAGISELPPGHLLEWDGGEATVRRWWAFEELAASPAPSPGELAGALRDAMRRHLVADVGVGLFLSSGADSAVLARLAAELDPGLRTYTVAFGSTAGGTADEAAGAAALAGRFGLAHEVVTVRGDQVAESLPSFLASVDQPTVDGLNSWLVSRAVRKTGLVVALSGLGGDELFAGYSTFHHVPRLAAAGRGSAGRAASLAAGAAGAALGRTARTRHSRARRAAEAVASRSWGEAYAAVRGLLGPAELARLWPEAPNLSAAVVEPGTCLPAAAVARTEVANYLPFQLLRDTDRMSMAHALEVRVPLLDDRVVALAARGLAGAWPWTKRDLLSAADPDLLALADRPKQTFTLPIDRWMRTSLLRLAEDGFVAVADAGLGFDRRALTELWHGFLAGRVGWRPAWAVAVLGAWLVDGPVAAARGLRA